MYRIESKEPFNAPVGFLKLLLSEVSLKSVMCFQEGREEKGREREGEGGRKKEEERNCTTMYYGPQIKIRV